MTLPKVISADPQHPGHAAMTAAFDALKAMVGHRQVAHEWTDNIALLHNAMWRLNRGDPCLNIAIDSAQRMRADLNALIDALQAMRPAVEAA